MKERKEFIEWAEKKYKKYEKVLKLQSYKVRIVFKNDLGNSLMQCTSRFPYKDPDVFYNNHTIEVWKKDKNEVERCLVHEMCHILTDAFYCKSLKRFTTQDEIEDERENLTDTIALIVYDVCLT